MNEYHLLSYCQPDDGACLYHIHLLPLGLLQGYQRKDTIHQVSQMYMSSVSDQITRDFDTASGLRLDRLEFLVKAVVIDDIYENPAMQELLINIAHDGSSPTWPSAVLRAPSTRSMVMTLAYEFGPFLSSLIERQKKVAVGIGVKGTIVVMDFQNLRTLVSDVLIR